MAQLLMSEQGLPFPLPAPKVHVDLFKSALRSEQLLRQQQFERAVDTQFIYHSFVDLSIISRNVQCERNRSDQIFRPEKE